MIIYTDWLNRDNREYYACFRYILFRCCKPMVISDDEGEAKRVYKPIDFMDMKWIIDRCNYLKGKGFNLDFIPYSLLNWYDEIDWEPNYFNCDWNCEYKVDMHGKIKTNKKGEPIKLKKKWESKEEDFIAPADKWIMNKIIRRWKIYGKWLVKLDNSIYRLKRKLTRSK
ncbi:MAG: hypothetical protein J5691_01635 [Bacilli bacterium]|nr:hypothetical protein [Bacilli bacterium]